MRCLAAFLLVLPMLAWGAVPDLSSFGYQPHPGARLPLDARFHDDAGRVVRLGDIVDRPTILALVYYRCPNLCGVMQGDLLNALAISELATPADYRLVTISIDPEETSEDAAQARRADLAAFPAAGAADGWRFLTGDAASIRQVADVVGFRDAFQPAAKQFIHPAGVVFVSASGVVSGYLLGVGYSAGEVRAGVIRAGEGVVAKAVLPVLLLCFHFDPATGRYTFAVLRLMQVTAVLFALTLGGALWLAFRRERPARPVP